ncbi:MAG: hypothetical protein AAB415_03005 [Patescibacteria group bacterium]
MKMIFEKLRPAEEFWVAFKIIHWWSFVIQSILRKSSILAWWPERRTGGRGYLPQCLPNSRFFETPFEQLFEYFKVDEFVQLLLKRVLLMGLWIDNQTVTALAFGTING